MKATLTYECNEPGHEQKMVVTATGDFDKPGGTINIKMEFEPAVSDDTSDPVGLLSAAIGAFQSYAGKSEC